VALREIIVDGRRFSIAYKILNPQAEHDLLFLHGWGSNKEVMELAFGRTLPEFRHIYLDLPGFGKSPNEVVLTTRDYARIVEAFLQAIGGRKDVVVGHSFGGKVATLLAPKLLVLLASAGIPRPKPWRVQAKIALFKLLKPFGGGWLRPLFVAQDAKGMDEVMYATFKGVVDEDFRSIFASYPGEALLVWGREDRATPLSSGEVIANLMAKARLVVLDGDHYFFLNQGDPIAQLIKERYEELSMPR